MSGIETISKCPRCGKAALSKWESSSCGFMFDACPHCLFLNHQVFLTCETASRVSTWQVILKARETSIAELRDTLKSYDPDLLDPPVFNYASCSSKEMEFYTKLGGEKLFNQNPSAYVWNYYHSHPTTRIFNLLEKGRLQRALQFGGSVHTPLSLLQRVITGQTQLDDQIPF